MIIYSSLRNGCKVINVFIEWVGEYVEEGTRKEEERKYGMDIWREDGRIG